MKSQLIKKTLVAIALGSLGVIATVAQANDNRGSHEYSKDRSGYVQFDYGTQRSRDNDREPQFNHDHHAHGDFAYQQSQRFSQQINERQHRQMDRIQAGKHSGSLTRYAFRELMREHHHIRAMEQHFLADGIIDAREFNRLDHALDMASRSIRSEKHDQQARNQHRTTPWYN